MMKAKASEKLRSVLATAEGRRKLARIMAGKSKSAVMHVNELEYEVKVASVDPTAAVEATTEDDEVRPVSLSHPKRAK